MYPRWERERSRAWKRATNLSIPEAPGVDDGMVVMSNKCVRLSNRWEQGLPPRWPFQLTLTICARYLCSISVVSERQCRRGLFDAQGCRHRERRREDGLARLGLTVGNVVVGLALVAGATAPFVDWPGALSAVAAHSTNPLLERALGVGLGGRGGGGRNESK